MKRSPPLTRRRPKGRRPPTARRHRPGIPRPLPISHLPPSLPFDVHLENLRPDEMKRRVRLAVKHEAGPIDLVLHPSRPHPDRPKRVMP